MIKKLFLGIGLLAAVLGGVFWYQRDMLSSKSLQVLQQGTWLKNPRMISPFHLTDINHQQFANDTLQGHWTMMFFGFTRCGSICPIAMANLAKMYHQLEVDHVRPLPRVMMVTIDPARDDLQRLATYVHAFNPNFSAARGDSSQLQGLTHQLGIVYLKVKVQHDKKNVAQIDHSGTIILFNPRGEVVAFFTMPHHASLMAQDYQLMIRHG